LRLLKESVLRVWHDRKASVKNEVANAEHRAKAIQQKLDHLDDAFIYQESIDLGTYERQRDRLREELTLVEIDRHGSKVEEFDVEGTGLKISSIAACCSGLLAYGPATLRRAGGGSYDAPPRLRSVRPGRRRRPHPDCL
jgi:hypothetical protein